MTTDRAILIRPEHLAHLASLLRTRITRNQVALRDARRLHADAVAEGCERSLAEDVALLREVVASLPAVSGRERRVAA